MFLAPMPLETLQNAVQNSMATMPSANTATNTVTEMINTGLKNIVGNVPPVNNKGANNKLMNFFGNNKAANNKSQTIPGFNFRPSEI